MSGIFVISAWDCIPGVYTVQFDGGSIIELSYGSERLDTPCTDPNNGIVSIFNYNLLGQGSHTAEFFRDGVKIATVTFQVVTSGVEFLTGVSGTGVVTLSNGQDVTVQWSQGAQGFIATGYTQANPPAPSGLCVTKTATVGDDSGVLGSVAEQATWVVTNPCDGETLVIDITPLTSDGFFACSGRLDFVQGGVQFSSSSFDWFDRNTLDGVCDTVLSGLTKQTTVDIGGNITTLNFLEPFNIFYADVLIFEFP